MGGEKKATHREEVIGPIDEERARTRGQRRVHSDSEAGEERTSFANERDGVVRDDDTDTARRERRVEDLGPRESRSGNSVGADVERDLPFGAHRPEATRATRALPRKELSEALRNLRPVHPFEKSRDLSAGPSIGPI
jgi:hypothetical protein